MQTHPVPTYGPFPVVQPSHLRRRAGELTQEQRLTQAKQSFRQAAADATVSRTWPDRRIEERRTLDTRVDVDPTNAWLGEADRRHGERRQYKASPVSVYGSSL